MPYLHTIGLENFRLFKEKTVFELAPITILTGINSSGKSSLIKSLQLFKSSLMETGNFNKLSFLRGNHNLGNFSKAVHEESEKKEMKFIFDFPVWGFTEKILLELTYLPSDKDGEDGYVSYFKIYIDQGENLFIYDSKNWKKGDENTHEAFFINFPYLISYSLHKLQKGDWLQSEKEISIPKIYWGLTPTDQDFFKSSIDGFFNPDKFWDNIKWDLNEDIFEDYKSIMPEEKIRIEKIIERSWNEGLNISFFSLPGFSLIDGLYQAYHEILNGIGNEKPSFTIGGEDYKDKQLYQFSKLGDIVFKKIIKKSIIDGFKEFEHSLKNIEHLSSIRANSDRLYSNHSDIFGINELLREYSKIRISQESPVNVFVRESLKKFNLGDSIEIRRTQGIASEIFIKKNNKEYLLADLGFGYTQLLPIILKIAIIANQADFFPGAEDRPETILLLEEPESNLHPSYQSKLAELIVEAASLFNIQFIVETHSEYLIRNLQYLTATKKIKPRDTKIYYFHQPGTEDFKDAPYRVIEIREDGRLSNEFGEGFFDEIPRLLAFLYNSNSN